MKRRTLNKRYNYIYRVGQCKVPFQNATASSKEVHFLYLQDKSNNRLACLSSYWDKKVALLLIKLIAICRWGRKPSLQTCSTDEGNKWLPKYWYLVLARLININSGKKRQVLIILNGIRWQTSSWCYAFFQLSENSLFWILENV